MTSKKTEEKTEEKEARVEDCNIFTQMNKVMADIGAIAKSHKASMGKGGAYMFRGIDDVYKAVNKAMVEHKVGCFPELLDLKREQKQTSGGATALYTIVTMKYKFTYVDGTCIDVVTVGEAMDFGDKSCNKAMSAAQKYAFFQTFCIPTEKPKDSENDTFEIATDTKPDIRKNDPDAGEPTSKPDANGNSISEGQRKMLHVQCGKAGIDYALVKSHYKVEHLADLKMSQVNDALDFIARAGKGE